MPEPAADRYAAPVGGVLAPPGTAARRGRRPPRPIPPAETVEASPTKRLGLLGWFSILWLGGITLLALLAPWLPLPDPDKSYLEIVARRARSSPGTCSAATAAGRDMLTRVIFGARVVARDQRARPCSSGSLIGGLLGLLAGYFRGDGRRRAHHGVQRAAVHPGAGARPGARRHLRQRPARTSSNGRKSAVLVAALAIVTVPLLGRITRAEHAGVVGARVRHGRRGARRRPRAHHLPRGPAQRAAGHVLDRPARHRGGDRRRGQPGPARRRRHRGAVVGQHDRLGRSDLARAPHIVVVPSIAIFLTVLALNYLGDVVRARFDVREAAL